MKYRLVTFDVYSALVDFEGGLVSVVRALRGDADAVALVRAWRAKQLEYAQISNSLQRGRIAFRVLTRRSLDYVLGRMGIDLAEPRREELVDAWDRLPPWPEADSTLLELAARGYALALLSNGDEAMLRALARGFQARFTHFLSSEQAGHYKPHPCIYRLPEATLGLEQHEVLHVAGSGNDVLGAKLAGLPCAWANRHRDRLLDPNVRPDFETADLSGLLERL